MVEGTPKIPTIQHFKRVKEVETEVRDQEISKVATIEEGEEEGKMIRAMYNVIIVKSLDILLMNVMPTKRIDKKLKQSLQGKKIMRVHG